jgi:hypothetical protein
MADKITFEAGPTQALVRLHSGPYNDKWVGYRFSENTKKCLPVSRGSSVSIVSGYGLDDRAIGIRSLAEAKGFFL